MIAEDLRRNGFNVSVKNENIWPLQLEKYDDGRIFGISSTTATAQRAYDIGDRIKELHQDSTVVMGGPHVTFMQEEALQHCDIVVKKEGIETMREISQSVIHGNGSLEDILGLSYKENGSFVENKDRPIAHNLEFMLAPAFDLIEGLGKKPAFYRRKVKMPVLPILLRLGCPFNCKFCCVVKMFGRKFRSKTVDQSIDEIKLKEKYVQDGLLSRDRFGDISIFFVDDNFCPPDSEEDMDELVTRILDENLHEHTRFAAQVRADFALKNKELLKKMKKANFYRFYIGYESANDEVLKSMRKGITKEIMIENTKVINDTDIDLHGMFIGQEPIHTIDEILGFSRQLRLKTIQILALIPLPGTDTYNELEAQGRIFNKNWIDYDGHFPVIKPYPVETMDRIIKVHQAFYSSTAHLNNGDWKNYFINKYIYHHARKMIRKWDIEFRKYAKKWQDFV